MILPPGFRFHPTDEELVAYYLWRKVAGRAIEFNIITGLDLYKQEPWDLPDKSFLPGSEMEWYFFSPRDKKYPNGQRTNRATEAGYWKATGKDRNVKKQGRTVGMKKTLVFYRGRAPHGKRTDWVMHEYRLDDECERVHAAQDLFVLCRVFEKSGVGPRSGEDRGPQIYVDDDIDREPCGSFAEAVKWALEPGPASTSAVAPIPEETAEVAPLESSPISAPSLSVEAYAPGGEAGDIIDLPTPVLPKNCILDEPTFSQNDDGQIWDCFPSSITAELDLPTSADDPFEQFSSELFGAWQGDMEADTLRGMMWSSDQRSNILQQQQLQEGESNVGGGYMDILQLELLGTDDVLPALVEELESNNPPRDTVASGVPSNNGENENQMLRGRGPARARSRAERLQPTSEEAQQLARSSNDGLNRYEATPQQQMSNTNFSGPEVPSQGGEDSTNLNVMWPAPQDSASINFDTNQLPPSSDPTSSVSATNFGISGVPEDNLFAFQDCFSECPVRDEFNALPGHEDNDFSFVVPHELVGERGSSEVAEPAPPDKSVKLFKSAVSGGPPRFSSSIQEGPTEKTRPLAGLMKLLGSLPALPASAAECPPDVMLVQTNGEIGSTFSSIHLSAVTVTCTSSVDGAQKVQAAVTDCHLQGDAQGVYQQVVSASWQTIPVEEAGTKQGSERQKSVCASCDTATASSVLQRRVARGSNSGFVFVFVLGVVSALCWFLVLRGMWRLASHAFSSVF